MSQASSSPEQAPGQVVIAVYRPHPGREVELRRLLERHVPLLRSEGLATERAPVLARSADGALVEVFEWVSEAAANAAHDRPAVVALWEAIESVGDIRCLASLAEAAAPFSRFAALI